MGDRGSGAKYKNLYDRCEHTNAVLGKAIAHLVKINGELGPHGASSHGPRFPDGTMLGNLEAEMKRVEIAVSYVLLLAKAVAQRLGSGDQVGLGCASAMHEREM